MKVDGPFPMRRRPKHFGDFENDITVYGNDAANIAASGADYLKTLFSNSIDFAKAEFQNAANLNLDALARDPVNFVTGATQQTTDYVQQSAAQGAQAASDALAVDTGVAESALSSLIWPAVIIVGGIAAFYYFRD